MKQPDSLEFVDSGTLLRPGIVGRMVRLLMGAACFYALFQISMNSSAIIYQPITVMPNLAVMSLVALCIVNYVVNIGFGKNWGRYPSFVSVMVLLVAAFAGWVYAGTPDHAILGFSYWLWLFYFFAHLGLSFVLAAVLATPGCEMRAIPELLGKIMGYSSQEHDCPVSLITKLDEWEAKTLWTRP